MTRAKTDDRASVRHAQEALAKASEDVHQISVSGEQIQVILAGLDTQIAINDSDEQTEVENIISAIRRGESPDVTAREAISRFELVSKRQKYLLAAEELKNHAAKAEEMRTTAEAALKEAIAGCVADYVEKRLQKAATLDAEMRTYLPILNAGGGRNVPGLRDFVCQRGGHDLPHTNEDVGRVRAALLAWENALTDDPEAQFSEEAGDKLLAVKRAEEAERAAALAAEEEAFRAEMQAQRWEETRPQREANEKYLRDYPEDPTFRNRFPPQGTYLPDPCAAILRNSSHEGNSN